MKKKIKEGSALFYFTAIKHSRDGKNLVFGHYNFLPNSRYCILNIFHAIYDIKLDDWQVFGVGFIYFFLVNYKSLCFQHNFFTLLTCDIHM